MSDILAIIAKQVEKNTGKSVDQVLKEAQEAEIRGEKITLPLPLVKAKEPEKPAQISFTWGESLRGVPNSVLRSALFGAIKRGKRKTMFREKLASQGGISVVFTGYRLDQADLDVWQQVLHISRNSPFGTEVAFSGGGFLKAIGRNTSGASHEWLKDSLTRLQVAAVELSDGKKTFSGTLIHNWYLDEVNKNCVVKLNPDLVNLFSRDTWTGIEWEQRKALKGKPLALWLHGFYSSHKNPFDIKIETLHKWCGSETKDIYAFNQMMKEALVDLSEAAKWNCRIEGDKVQIFKKPEQLIKRLAK